MTLTIEDVAIILLSIGLLGTMSAVFALESRVRKIKDRLNIK